METKMISLGLLLFVAAVSAVDVTNLNQLAAAKKSQHIIFHDIEVPAGGALNLERLKTGTVVEFAGRITFGYKEWRGPLIRISGRNIKVQGKPGHLFDCQGERWWDTRGFNGGKQKPKFMAVKLSDSSIDGLQIKNLPVHGFALHSCRNLNITNVKLDVTEGHTKGGHNTDGFDVNNCHKLRITNCYVDNQDDCLAINSGSEITFEDNTCIGGHGISIGSVGGRSNNVVEKVRVRRCKVQDSDNGIRIKSIKFATGAIRDIVYDDVELKNIANRGIVIQGNYLNGGFNGEPTGGVPITDLTINNVRGNVSPPGANVEVLVMNASNWKWSNINVWGGMKAMTYVGLPPGVSWN